MRKTKPVSKTVRLDEVKEGLTEIGISGIIKNFELSVCYIFGLHY